MRTEDFDIEHSFVEFIPNDRDEGKIYISIEYATAVHNCFCGRGTKVVTPISPTGWQLTFDGEAVTLYPSVGNWGFKCRSHYWIRNNRVVWAGEMSKHEIELGRIHDKAAREKYFSKLRPLQESIMQKKIGLKRKIWDWLTGEK
jgi:hypothetical protein